MRNEFMIVMSTSEQRTRLKVTIPAGMVFLPARCAICGIAGELPSVAREMPDGTAVVCYDCVYEYVRRTDPSEVHVVSTPAEVYQRSRAEMN